MHDSIDLAHPHRPIKVGVILVNSETEILDVAPIDIFNGLSKEFVSNMPDYLLTDDMRKQALEVEYHWVTENGEPGRVTAGGKINATHSFITCPPLDVVLMGAHSMGYTLSKGEIDFIRKTAEHCAAFLFVCGGFLAGLQAGLLEGKTATAPRPMVQALAKMNPEVNWVTKRWAQDGKIWTSGALLNGTDMTKEFALSIWGGEGSLAEFGMRLGGYPCRDVNYADVEWEI